MSRSPPCPSLFPYTTLFRSDLPGEHPTLGRVTLRQLLAAWVVHDLGHVAQVARVMAKQYRDQVGPWIPFLPVLTDHPVPRDRKSTRLNSSHLGISYAVFCLK